MYRCICWYALDLRTFAWGINVSPNLWQGAIRKSVQEIKQQLYKDKHTVKRFQELKLATHHASCSWPLVLSHLFFLLTLIKYLLCARSCAQCWGLRNDCCFGHLILALVREYDTLCMSEHTHCQGEDLMPEFYNLKNILV